MKRLLLFFLAGMAAFGEDTVERVHRAWPPPESVVRDLRSGDEEARHAALLLAGVPEQVARRPVYNGATPPVVVGSKVVKADQVELRYAALGGDATEQAVVVVEVGGQSSYAAVVAPKGKGWERIATASCWCKYEEEVVDAFVSVSPAPEFERYELVFRESGGGTGIYRQNETHFRVYRGELKAVMSFVSRVEAVPRPPGDLEVERRWFSRRIDVGRSDGGSDQVAVLAESRGRTAVPPGVYFSIREMQDRFVNGLKCSAFRWNEKLFEYEPVSVSGVCGSAAE